MASMGSSHLDPEPLCRAIKGPAFLNKVLIAICKAENLQSQGVKADLQRRISDKIRLYAQTNNVAGFSRLKARIENPHQQHHPPIPSYNASPVPPSPYGGVIGGLSSYHNGSYQMAPVNGGGYRPSGSLQIEYKPSPFYTPRAQLGLTKPCDSESECAHFPRAKKADKKEAMTQHRHTVDIHLRVSDHSILDEATRDKSLRVMVFCAGEAGPGKQDVAFPHQSEIKVNGGDVKANLRGLKNKPGSTRPVDITNLLRLKPVTYTNTVQMTYALTTKKYYLSAWVVKTTPVEDLVKRLEVGNRISKDSVLREMLAKASDPDIETTSSVLSLKCPLSTLRISLPCRSVRCKHNQCFDATSYLQLQEQGPTWLCPICSNPAPFESLVVDEYLKDILNKTKSSLEQVTVEPDGNWSTATKTETPKFPRPMAFGSDDDDDLVEIRDDRVAQLKNGNSSTPQPMLSGIKTPDSNSFDREPSSASRRQSSKRPVAEVVDLTLSDDEDDMPQRPMKRQFIPSSSTYNSPLAWAPNPM